MRSCCAGTSKGPADPPAHEVTPSDVASPWLPAARTVSRPGARARGQVLIPAGGFWMGDAYDEGYAGDGEGPARVVEVDAFRLDATAVTNATYSAFVKATGHESTAEREGTSAVFESAYSAGSTHVLGRPVDTPWWLIVAGASWRHPEGPGSDIATRPNHPVVHISHGDARAYCEWSGKRLPTEAEWEKAARGGLDRARFVWGDELMPRGRWLLNIFQGDFPTTNTIEDGYATTAPVKAFTPNGYGLSQMSGNTWEWCADWFSPDTYLRDSHTNPTGPASGTTRVMRGGSYLCHDSYCNRYRVAARTSAPADTTSGNLGFRCATDA